MSLAVVCPACNARLKLPEHRAGETVACRACGEDIEVPTAAEAGANRKKKRKKSKGAGKGLLLGAAIGGGVLLIVVAVVMVVLMRRSKTPTPDGKKDIGNPQIEHPNMAALKKIGAKFLPDPKNAAERPLGVLVMASPDYTNEHLALASPLTQLTRISLKGARITDEGLAHLKDLTNLESLTLSNTNINGKGLAHLRGLSRLTALEIDGTKVTDATAVELHRLKGLKIVNIQRTSLSETAIADLRKAMPGTQFVGPPPFHAFSSPAGRFKVVFPWQMPKTTKRTMPTPAGNVNDTAFLVDYGSYSASVTYADFDTPALKEVDLETIINAGRDAIARQHSATIGKDQPITLMGHPGREVIMTFPDRPNQGPVSFRWYIVGRRLYSLAIMADGGTVEPSVANRFFSSFALTN